MAPRDVPGRLLRRARSDPLAHLRHGTAHRALAHSGSAAAPALRAHRAAARVAQLAPPPRPRQRPAEPVRHHLQRAAPRHDVPGPQFPAVSVGQLGLRAAGRGRFEPARARSAAVRGTTATEVVPAAGDGERGRQDRAAVRRAGGLAERLQPAVPAAGLPRVDPAARHALRVEPESLLHRTLGTVAAHVNSRHHQAIRALAPTLRATAWAADGVVEGVERADRAAPWTLAVQWHPEDDTEDALFRGFAEAIA